MTRAEAATAGAAVGAMTSFWDLGVLIAGMFGGLLTAQAGFRAAFWVAALAALASLTLAVQRREGPRHRDTPARA